MATIVLQAAGAYLGGFLGTTGAAIGTAAGAIAGYLADRALISSTESREGPRLSGFQPFTAEEGAALPRVFGTVRLSGVLIWATRFQETSRSEREGFKGGPKLTTYSYFANAAFALCEGPVAHVRRVWADGREVDLTQVEIRIHHGREDQLPDPLIEAKQGAAGAPAYRGTAYAVIDHFPIDDYGGRLPQFQFEVIRSVGGLNEAIRAVTLIPGATEYGLATTRVTRTLGPGVVEDVNRHVLSAPTDIAASLDELQALCPNLERIGLVVAWFGDDLRAGHCTIRPMVTPSGGVTFSAPWLVSGVTRGEAAVVSSSSGGAAYGGTPSDASVIEAIAEIRARGLAVALYPFVMMDVPVGNTLPNPYGGTGQPAYPWRGRISCDPAPGEPGTSDKTAAARTQIEAFAGETEAGDFTVASGAVGFTGGDDWGYRRLVLHYAHLAVAAGGVDAFLIGSEMRGVTTLRDEAGAFPFVETLAELAGEVRAVLGPETKLTYGADWTEYFGHQPQDGSGDVLFHLDPLWAHPAIDAVGIDNYMPLSDWRDRDYAGSHPDGWDGPYDPAGLRAAIAGGEGYDWHYGSVAAREARERTPITDGAYGKPWTFRYKDIEGWWANPHHDRPGGVEELTPTAWVPRSKPIWFTELGCPAVDKGPNQPNVFPDPKSSESAIPYFSNGGRSDMAQRRFLEAHLGHWDPAVQGFVEAANPESPVYGGRMVDPGQIHLWAWDARPFAAFPLQRETWSDGDNWLTGHWLTGRLGKAPVGAVLEEIAGLCGVAVEASAADGTVHGFVAPSDAPARAAMEPLIQAFDLAAPENGGVLTIATAARTALDPILLDDLVVDDETASLSSDRGAAETVPASAAIGYRDPLLDHQLGTASATRPDGEGDGAELVDLGAAIEAGEAEALAAERLRRLALGRETATFGVPAQERRFDPGDMVRLARDGFDGEWLVESIDEGLLRRVTARRVVRLAPLPARVALPPPQRFVSATGQALVLFLDLPLGPGGGAPEDQMCVAAFARPWMPQLLYLSPEETGFAERASLASPATVGVLTEPAPAGREGLVDEAGSLTVRLYGGALESVSRLQMLNGRNAAAMRSASGVWEIVQFETADEFEPSVWRLTGLLRGQLGTDDAMRAGAAAGAEFVLLDAAVVPAGLAATETGLELVWRSGPAGRDFSDPAFQTGVVTGGLRARLPLSPAHLRAVSSGGDLELSWIRRGRIDADGWLGPDIPLGEDFERYSVEIGPAGGVVVRSAETATPSWTWSAAEQAADFPMRPVEIDIAVRQIGATIGPGVARTLRLTLE